MTEQAMVSKLAISIARTDFVRVELRVRHPNSNPNELADALGLTPHRTGVKGEVRGSKTRRLPSPGRPETAWPFHYASFSFGGTGGREQFDAALRVVEAKSIQLEKLTEDGGRVMLSVFVSPKFGWAIEVGAAELAVLARAGVVLGLEFYVGPDDEHPPDGDEPVGLPP